VMCKASVDKKGGPSGSPGKRGVIYVGNTDLVINEEDAMRSDYPLDPHVKITEPSRRGSLDCALRVAVRGCLSIEDSSNLCPNIAHSYRLCDVQDPANLVFGHLPNHDSQHFALATS